MLRQTSLVHVHMFSRVLTHTHWYYTTVYIKNNVYDRLKITVTSAINLTVHVNFHQRLSLQIEECTSAVIWASPICASSTQLLRHHLFSDVIVWCHSYLRQPPPLFVFLSWSLYSLCWPFCGPRHRCETTETPSGEMVSYLIGH